MFTATNVLAAVALAGSLFGASGIPLPIDGPATVTTSAAVLIATEVTPAAEVPTAAEVTTSAEILADAEILAQTGGSTGNTLRLRSPGPQEERRPIDVNSATADDLQKVPGIGEALARRIIDFREEHGPFEKIDDLLNVRGIGTTSLEKLRPYLAVKKQG